jgi:hypothetical protein
LAQLKPVGQYGLRRSFHQPGIEPDIYPGDQLSRRCRPVGQCLAYGRPAGEAMANELPDMGLWPMDRAAMGRPIDRVGSRRQAVKGSHVVDYIAVGRGDDRRRPAHDVIAGKERFFLWQSKTQMIGGMARRVQCL